VELNMFELEKKAIEYCTQYGITEDDMRRSDIINAFCVGADIEREECASICDKQAKEPECPERAMYCADAIRERV
jgi:hypothetical protein